MNPDVSCVDGWQDLARHRIVNVVIAIKELGWKENAIIERLNKNDVGESEKVIWNCNLASKQLFPDYFRSFD